MCQTGLPAFSTFISTCTCIMYYSTEQFNVGNEAVASQVQCSGYVLYRVSSYFYKFGQLIDYSMRLGTYVL